MYVFVIHKGRYRNGMFLFAFGNVTGISDMIYHLHYVRTREIFQGNTTCFAERSFFIGTGNFKSYWKLGASSVQGWSGLHTPVSLIHVVSGRDIVPTYFVC